MKKLKKNTIEATLQERGKRYGAFEDHATITQSLKAVMKGQPTPEAVDDLGPTLTEKWERLAPDMQEALEMIAHKIGRILNGDETYVDSWVDIAGYAELVSQRLQGKRV